MKLSKTELDIRRKFDWATIRDRNCIKFDERSGKAHRLAVLDYCRDLILQDIAFFTRARMKAKTTGFPHTNQLCCDILIPDLRIVIEVVDSESEKSIERKREIWKKEGLVLETIEVRK